MLNCNRRLFSRHRNIFFFLPNRYLYTINNSLKSAIHINLLFNGRFFFNVALATALLCKIVNRHYGSLVLSLQSSIITIIGNYSDDDQLLAVGCRLYYFVHNAEILLEFLLTITYLHYCFPVCELLKNHGFLRAIHSPNELFVLKCHT